MIRAPFSVGDHVEPRAEWASNANAVPSGVVRAIAPWGKEGALYVGSDRRAFAAFVFQRVVPPPVAKAVGELL